MRVHIHKTITLLICLGLMGLTGAGVSSSAYADHASIVVDADSSVVLHARNTRLRSYPASLAKLMTTYIIFEAMAAGQLELQTKMRVSAAAAGQYPVKLGLNAGRLVTVEKALQALIIRSANDATVVAAEKLAGSETAFAERMTAKARALGMRDTVFRNATGLPHAEQFTTARDMAVLTRALIRRFPRYSHLFAGSSFTYGGKTYHATTPFIQQFDGAMGFKTGFTCRAGYNMVSWAERDGMRLIGVILGEPDARRRYAKMVRLLEDAFKRKQDVRDNLTLASLKKMPGQGAGRQPTRQLLADTCLIEPRPSVLEKISGWGLVVGVRKDKNDALTIASGMLRRYREWLQDGRPAAIAFLRGVLLYRAIIHGLEEDAAKEACRQVRLQNEYCIVMNPQILQANVTKSRTILKRLNVSINP